MNKQGSLTVVGTGIKIAGDMTLNTQAQIKQADIVFTVVPDKVSKQWLAKLNPNTVDMTEFYGSNKSRLITYNEMANALVESVKQGNNVCAAFYGHPGVFAYASHLAIRQLKALGYRAKMQPGISAEDWLVADLGIDPGKSGCISIEATQFLFYQRTIDPYSLLVLWQIGLVGDHTLALDKTDNYQRGLKVLSNELLKYYPSDHQVIIYEAATLALFPPRIEHIALAQLPQAKLTAISTLAIPPYQEAPLDLAVLKQLGLTPEDIDNALSIDK
ncbi:SAM-dependent methyltransferase [Psychrobium sp. 1_MG-2023]|uniref:SAM-dependent methyltransferase n=1 Tax=Psychrobium sp. 1_MG-2023 TaxID=3062624 RepID=UPI000C33363C|nr:SAM-dependent methyltransferase [Psychrobium sp. 1_MG-2023]MDP2562301.1 SAM-dependent methyltransferase [Psychrobium sp. 1_MG-2023]PKF54684.1 hypothetical protein CW748_15615 [Alteromonadales bacterium alter-6D02]